MTKTPSSAPQGTDGQAPSPWYRQSPEDVRGENVHPPEVVLKRPGRARFSQQATAYLGQVGTDAAETITPLWALITRDAETKAGIFLRPCKPGTPDALPINYVGKHKAADMRLMGPCRAYSYHIPKLSNLVVPVSIYQHSIHGPGLFLDFANATERPIRKLGPLAQRRAAKQQKQQPAQQPPHIAPPLAPEHK